MKARDRSIRRKDWAIRNDVLDVEPFPDPISALGHQRSYEYSLGFNDEPHFRDYWRAVRRRLWFVVALTALVTLSVGAYLFSKQDIYEAEAQVQVNLENSNPSPGAASNSGVNDPAYFNTQLQLLARPWLLRRVIKTLDLEHNPGFLTSRSKPSFSERLFPSTAKDHDPSAPFDWPEDVVGQKSTTPEDIAEATRLAPYVAALQEGLTIDPVKESRLPIRETRLIDIHFSHRNPVLAAQVVNTLADAFVLSNLQKKASIGASTGDVLQKRIAELKSQISQGEEQLINYSKTNQIVSLEPGQNTAVDRLAGLNRQLLDAENQRKFAESAYLAALPPGAATALAEENGRLVVEAENKLADLRQRREQLLVEATEEWPEVKEIDRQIAALQQDISQRRDRAAKTIVTNLETRYRQAQASEQSLRNAFETQRADLMKQNEAAVQYRIIQQEIEASKTLLEGLLQRRKENEGMLAGLTNNIQVNDYAVVPQNPIAPRRWLYTGFAFVFSLGLGIGLALLANHFDNTIRSTADVEQGLQLRTLASVPFFTKDSSMVPGSVNGSLRNGEHSRQRLATFEIRGVRTEIYRQLRTSLLLSGDTRPIKTFLITSSVPSEGKTTTAVNIAFSFARTGARVLIIDADSRSPQIDTLFGISNQKGLSTILSEEVGDSTAMELIQNDPESGIYILPSGPPLDNFTELCGSDRMQRLMKTSCSNFDFVIIDSPPVANFADSLVISQVVEGVVLVAKSGKSPSEIVEHCSQVLHDVGANILGVVLNGVKPLSYDYNYYYQQLDFKKAKTIIDVPPESKSNGSHRMLT